ncbi:MAG: class II aldolase/adducin family protein [Lachnospiraceae bacterium]
MDLKWLHPAQQIVMFMDRIYHYGMTTTSGGNLSIKDEEGNIWISPAGIDKSSLTIKDIVCVRPDGTVEGMHKPSSEFPFHKSIYEARPDLEAIVHAHPPALVAFSIARKLPNTRLIPNIRLVCGGLGLAEYGLPGSMDLGKKIAAQFADGNNSVILENHGVVVGEKSLFRAFMAFETLDFCARLEVNANRIGSTIPLSDMEIELSRTKNNALLEDDQDMQHSTKEKELRQEMTAFILRAYDQQLFTSTQGTFSQRLEGESFLITPYNKDRKYMEPEDLVKVCGDRKQAGKIPSRSVKLHQEIYRQHPHINAIIIAHPPNIMAYAVTDKRFDSRTIPESYILIRELPKLSFGATFIDVDKTAAVFMPQVPIAMVKNDCVISTGKSLLAAFDGLEVVEYSAKAVIDAGALGEVVKIGNREVADLIEAFHLPQ